MNEKKEKKMEKKHMRKMERMGQDIKKLGSLIKKSEKKENYKGKMC